MDRFYVAADEVRSGLRGIVDWLCGCSHWRTAFPITLPPGGDSRYGAHDAPPKRKERKPAERRTERTSRAPRVANALVLSLPLLVGPVGLGESPGPLSIDPQAERPY